jgi:hypothetical protein
MPVYEYICKHCRKSFEKILTLTEPRPAADLLPALREQERGAGSSCVLRGDVQEELNASHAGLSNW